MYPDSTKQRGLWSDTCFWNCEKKTGSGDSMAEIDGNLRPAVGDGAVGDFHQRKDSETEEIFEEAVDGQQSYLPSLSVNGDENGGDPQMMIDNGNADGHEVENFEESTDRPIIDQNGETVLELKTETDVGIPDPACKEGSPGGILKSAELGPEETPHTTANEEGNALEAFAVLEDVENERKNAGGILKSAELGPVETTKTTENGEGNALEHSAVVEDVEKERGEGGALETSAFVDDGEKERGEADIEVSAVMEDGEKERGKTDAIEVSAIVEDGVEVHENLENGDTNKVSFNDPAIVHVKSENEDFNNVNSDESHVGDQEKSGDLDLNEVNLGEIHSDVNEKTENGDLHEQNFDEVSSFVNEKSENGNANESGVHKNSVSGGLDNLQSGELDEQVRHQGKGLEMEDALSGMDVSIDEKMEFPQGKIAPVVGSLSEINEKTVSGSGEPDKKVWQDSLSQVSGDTQIGAAGHSDVVNRTDELIGGAARKNRDTQIGAAGHSDVVGRTDELIGGAARKNQDSDEICNLGGNSAPSKALERETVIMEDYDESSSSDEDDSAPSAQAASGVCTSSGNSVDYPPPHPRPAGLGSSAPFLEPTPRTLPQPRVNGSISQRQTVIMEDYDESSLSNEDDSAPSAQAASGVCTSSGNSVDYPPPPPRPAGLGSSAPLLEPTPRTLQQPRVNGSISQRQTRPVEEPANGDSEEYDETREKLQMIRVKFLRLAYRLGQTPHNVVVAQVLYRLGLAEQLRGSRNLSRAGAFSFDRASAMAEQLEAAGQEPLDFSCTIMVIGKTGVGKSATINSIFDEVKFSTDAFQLGTKKVQDIVGTVQGIKVRVIDTPGLLSSCLDQRHNKKILHSVKNFIKKTPPDIVLYLDRLDMQSRDYGDVPLLRTITDIFGPSIWFNAIVVLTHAASAPPDGPSGTPLSYEMFVTQRSHVVQQAIRQAAGDMRLMNPVSLVENHSACRTNRAGQRVLPNGQVWKPHLLLLSFASKILAEANTLLKLQDNPPGKPFGVRARVPPLPFLLSSLLQSRPQLKLPEEQFGDDDALDEDIDEATDSDGESEYDELPPFKRLTKAQLAKLSKAQRNAYYDELEYRENLFMKKQLKEERKRRKLLKKMMESAKESPDDRSENLDEESGAAASVPVPMPDMPLPTSFDSDNPTHRYRCLDNSNQWLVRPVLETHGWDHDVGYEGINVERLFVIKEKIPVSFSGQVTKDKKESSLQMELASSIKHSEGKTTSLGFDMQTVGKDMAYTLRSEMRFSNFRCNKTLAGLSVNILGDALSAGVKLEDILMIRKRLKLVMSGGAMTSRGDVAYGGSLEATLRDKDYPIGRMLSTLGLSIMDWHGDLAIGCNVQSQIPVGRTTNMIARANLNNKGAGQVSIRLNSSEQLQIALIAFIPVLQNIFKYMYGSPQPIQ